MSKKPENGKLIIEDDLDERYVAALLLLSEAEGCEVDESHQMVTEFLKEFELDVDRSKDFTTIEKDTKLH